jgi:hypothetical protein
LSLAKGRGLDLALIADEIGILEADHRPQADHWW